MRSPRLAPRRTQHPQRTQRTLRATLAGAAAVTLALGITSCSGGSTDADADNADLKIVASTAVWGSIAEQVVDDATDAGSTLDVSVSTILSGTDGDPHEYEATARDIADIRDADVVLGNGAGYDNWLTDNAASDAEVITAAEPGEAHDHDHDHGTDEDADHDHDHGDSNPHVWFNLDTVREFADNLASYLHSVDESFPDSATGVTEDLDEVSARLDKLPAAKLLFTEPVALDLINGTALTDVTPEGFADAVLTESEPSAADLASARDLIADGGVDVLVTNSQSQTAASTQLVNAAKDAGLTENDAVINVNESPDNDQSYMDYLDAVVSGLEKATGDDTEDDAE
ncbi:metal ABC transporter solute-binding protein, Zn/Mn family [Corynebacterium variabile]|uniref:ABC-type metal ion transport system, periplasmic component/surface adhesin n=1 Tax=Corynebacterium variabile TaxID=1727 RepID=A0A0X2NN06_9CORY|nr:zinc ABC transporter substrate-binding protein [Corynebacterium variabile]CUU66872.1 ABC-type metal ion transport system, periplasmic component/surface adhesin [Corynebacterium variabile]